MISVYIYLDKGKLVNPFVSEISKMNGDFILKSEFTELNAKSILGIYSMDLSKRLLLQISDDQYDLNLLEPYIAK